MLSFIGLKSSFPSPTPNHPTVPPGTPEHSDHPDHHPDHPEHRDHSEPLDHPEHSPHSFRLPSRLNLRSLMPQTQHLPADSHSDTHPILLSPQACPETAGQKHTATTRSVLTNPFHVSLILENKGSVARDHLALERTYLAYVRTSLAIASAGVALVQLFTISSSRNVHFSRLARPLGAITIVYGLIVLAMGTFRYFRIQHALPRGFFPTTLHAIAALAFFLGAFITVLFGILVGVKT